MNKKLLKIIAIIISFGLCFPLHFLYEIFPSFFTSIFAPVNASIWEHMKILFGSIILSGVIQKIIILIRKDNIHNICFSNFIAALLSIPTYLIMFLPLYYIFGENMFIAISIMLITIIIVHIVAYFIMIKEPIKLENQTILFVIIVYLVFAILTYYPIRNNLFIDPKTSTYGINNK